MVDFFIDNIVKNIIIQIINNKDNIDSNETLWFNLTKCMFRNYSAIQVYDQIEIALSEVSDDQWFENKYSEEEFNNKFVNPIIKKKGRIVREGNSITSKIVAKISILDIADRYGLMPLRKSKRICPFHADSNPSLSLSDGKGLFNCFGCSASGNIVDFVYLLRKYKIVEIKKW